MSAEPLRVAVFGPESTGKTRLAEMLAEHFSAKWVPEYAREFWDQHGVITLEDIPAIAREQWRREDELAATAGRLLFCDTEALTTVLWSDLLYGTCPDDLRRAADQRAKKYAVYLLLDTDVPFTPDPQRCFPDPADRDKCRRVWRGALERRHLPFVDIRGDWAEREKQAILAVERLVAGGRS
jgi:NadR type nicotinamide-nucleotide adenylyltransferase